MCPWLPASAGTTLLASLGASQSTSGSGPEPAPLKPVRMIRDPYAAYSSVAVDARRNEVVLTDENLFQILVYDRTANTPPTAKMTEPKRSIGGLDTKIEFQCGLYIDQDSGDIYAVNNDTVDTLVIFSRQAKGNVPPDRELHTPHGTFGIGVDEQAQELFLTIQHDAAVVVYNKMAKGEEGPIRRLQGKHTRLADPHGLALDTKDQLMFVSNHGGVHEQKPGGRAAVTYAPGGTADKPNWPVGEEIPGSGRNLPPAITVYPLKVSGDTPPLRVIEGPKTQMDWPTGLAYDEQRGELYVANDMGNSILVFDANASGDVAPKRILQGPKTNLKNPTGVWLDQKNNELWAANFGNHSATVYKLDASGDTAPLRMIRSGPINDPALGIGNPHPIAYDSKREEILVPN
jgi:DNA-binding beta-propeller fold protein YncE